MLTGVNFTTPHQSGNGAKMTEGVGNITSGNISDIAPVNTNTPTYDIGEISTPTNVHGDIAPETNAGIGNAKSGKSTLEASQSVTGVNQGTLTKATAQPKSAVQVSAPSEPSGSKALPTAPATVAAPITRSNDVGSPTQSSSPSDSSLHSGADPIAESSSEPDAA